MKRALKTISRYTQPVLLAFLLVSFVVQPAVIAEVSRSAEANNTEEVCSLTENIAAEVPARKKQVRAASLPATLPTGTASTQHRFSHPTVLEKPALEVSLRKLRI